MYSHMPEKTCTDSNYVGR